MRRDQLEHAIRTACQIIGHPAVIIVGSQAILGSFGEEELPVEATMSVEVDVLPISDNNTVTAELADLIKDLTAQMMNAARDLQFELAARIRDEVADLKKELRGMDAAGLK